MNVVKIIVNTVNTLPRCPAAAFCRVPAEHIGHRSGLLAAATLINSAMTSLAVSASMKVLAVEDATPVIALLDENNRTLTTTRFLCSTDSWPNVDKWLIDRR